MPGAYLYGWDTTGWREVRVDVAGHLQTDVLSSALPTGAARATNQAVAIGHITDIKGLLGAGLPAVLDTGSLKARVQNFPATYPLSAAQIALLQQVTEQGTPSVHLYGYDGANWQTLLTESAALKNLRVKLYDGANGIKGDPIQTVSILGTDYGLVTNSCLRIWGQSVLRWYRWSNAKSVGDTENGYEFPTIALMGYNGTTWDRLRMESSALHNLRVKLFDGANGIGSALLATVYLNTAQRGLHTNACLRIWNQTQLGWGRWEDATTSVDGSTGIRFPTIALMGYNGTTWDRIRVSANKSIMTKEEASNPTSSKPIKASQLIHDTPTHIYAITINKDIAAATVVRLRNGLDVGGDILWEMRVPGLTPRSKNFYPWLEFDKALYLEIVGRVFSVIIEYGEEI